MNVGIVGQGFVGSAIREGLKNCHNVITYDINPSRSMAVSLDQTVNNSEIIFVCLPTPMRESGKCDIRILENSIHKINQICKGTTKNKKIIVVKSTVPPGTTDFLNEKYKLDSEH